MRIIRHLGQDVRYALRTLFRARAFSVASILTLALGVGACVAVFTIVDAVLLRALPYPAASRLFLISHWQRSAFFPQLGNELSTITDFNGVVGAAEVQGTATGAGTTYDFDVDMRFMKGRYITVDGKLHDAAFAFV